MVLVTGGTGFVGSHLLWELVRQGIAVRALHRNNSNFEQVRNVFRLYSPDPEGDMDKIEWMEGDMLDIFSLEEAMEGVDDVYHCAAVMSFDPKDHRRMLKDNASGTANAVNTAMQKGIRKFCHVSSIAALGRPENKKDIIDENLVWKSSRNNSVYSISKYESEREVWRGIAEGLEAVIVNPSVILGYAGIDTGSAKLFPTAWKNTRFYPAGVNGFVDVRDVAAAMVSLMSSGIRNQRFILNSDNLSYRKLFEYMAASYHRPGPQIKVGPLPASLAWRAERLRAWVSGKSPLLTRETARTASKKHYYSGEKIREVLGFEFRPLEEAVADHCKHYVNFKF